MSVAPLIRTIRTVSTKLISLSTNLTNDNPSYCYCLSSCMNVYVCRAMPISSLAGSTKMSAGEAAVEITRLSFLLSLFFSSSSSTPKCRIAWQIFLRTVDEFSPMPPVNTR